MLLNKKKTTKSKLRIFTSSIFTGLDTYLRQIKIEGRILTECEALMGNYHT